MSTKVTILQEKNRERDTIALDKLPNAVAICDANSVILKYNKAFRSLFQHETEKPDGLAGPDLFAEHIKNKEQDVGLWPGSSRIALLKKSDGTSFWGLLSVSHISETNNEELVIQITDIDALKQSHDTLEYRESTWRNAIITSQHGVWDYYNETDEIYLSEGWKALRGIPDYELSKKCTSDWMQHVHPDDLARITEINRQHNDGKIDRFAYEYREKRRDGKWIWIYSRGQAVERDAQNLPVRVVGIDVDVTEIKQEEQRRVQELEVAYQKHLSELEQANNETEKARKKASIISNQDALTGLANRRAFSTQLAEFTGARGQGKRVSHFYLFLIDLNRFKPINDTYGHNTGDAVIQETAKRIQSSLCSSSVVARLGGDEFGVIVPCIDPDNGDNNARRACEKVIEAIQRPILVDDVSMEISASIGISRFPECGHSESLLLRRADIAMYEAKKDQLKDVVIFKPSMEQKVISQAKLEADVRDAVLFEKFVPFFQPLIDLESGNIHGFEALARWNDPEFGKVGPGTFIPIIEQFGMIRRFALPMLKKTFAATLDWGSACRITFNITANGICSKEIYSDLMSSMNEVGFPPERFVIEVSEMAMVADIDAASKNMDRFRDHGITFALDDFGVGYSGLSYLRTLSFETLKLDRSFISTMIEYPESEKIVHSVLSLAEQFGMETVAEGIETEDILQQVRNAGFKYGQGYFFDKAVPAAQAKKLLNLQACSQKRAG